MTATRRTLCNCRTPVPTGNFCAFCQGYIGGNTLPVVNGRVVIPRPKRYDANGKVVDVVDA